MKLRALKAKKAYKNTDAWLDAVYRKNKQFIDEKILPTDTSIRATFKELVKGYMENGYSPVRALDTLTRSTIFTDVDERLRNNAYKALKEDEEAYKAFRALTKDERGRYTAVDLDKFVYDKQSNSYIYGNVRIKFSNSPYGIIVEVIE